MSFQFQARLLDSVFRGPGHGTLSTQPRGSFYMRGSITLLFLQFSLSVLSDCDPVDCSMPGLPVHHQLQSLLILMSIESVMPSSHLILCRPLLLLPSIFPSIRVFSNESALCIRWPKYCSFSISPSNEYSGLISFRTDWFDLLAVQGLSHQFLGVQLYGLTLTSIHDYWKNHSFD